MRPVSFIVFSEDADVCAHVSQGLLATNAARIQSTVSRASLLGPELQKTRVDGIYIDTNVEGDESVVFDAITNLPEPRPLLLFGGKDDDPELLLKAMRAGGRDFFVAHKLDGLKSIIESATPKHSLAAQAAPILAVVGSKGGVGATTIACELAVALQESGTRTIVLDLNLCSGDVPLYFDLQTHYSIADLARKDGALDEILVEAVVAEHTSGVSILAAPTNFEDIGVLNFPQIERILTFIEKDFDCIILDLPWGYDEMSLRALDRASHILLVATADVPSLTHTRSMREMMERFGNDPDRIRVILNRYSKKSTFDPSQVAEFVECSIEVPIPDTPEATQECMNEGKLLRDAIEGAAMAKALRGLRDRVAEWCKFDPLDAQATSGGVPLVERLRNLLKRS